MRTIICFAFIVVSSALLLLACAGPEPTATPKPQTPTTNEPQSGIPVYEREATWGEDPSDGVHFTSPNGIAIDSSGNVYVTEFRGNQVQKFTSTGVLVAQWGSEGSEDGQFQNPTGIAIDREDNVYISESGNHRVQKFTSDGQWLASWGSQGSDEGEFLSAMVIAADY